MTTAEREYRGCYDPYLTLAEEQRGYPEARRRLAGYPDAAHTRGLQFSKFGLAEDPRGLHVLMPAGTLREVYGVYVRESAPRAVMLQVRSFNREIIEEIAAGAARILDRSWETQS